LPESIAFYTERASVGYVPDRLADLQACIPVVADGEQQCDPAGLVKAMGLQVITSH
jgi:hypothetical protein